MRFAFLGFLLALALANDETHVYKDGDEVLVWANKLGPFNNPLETYSYFSLPFCAPAQRDGEVIMRHSDHFGESLLGDELRLTHIDARFKHDRSPTILCTRYLTPHDVEDLATAIRHKYWYNFVVDALPMWAYVGVADDGGEIDGTEAAKDVAAHQSGGASSPHGGGGGEGGRDDRVALYTLQTLRLGYNGAHIVEASLVAGEPVTLPCGGGGGGGDGKGHEVAHARLRGRLSGKGHPTRQGASDDDAGGDDDDEAEVASTDLKRKGDRQRGGGGRGSGAEDFSVEFRFAVEWYESNVTYAGRYAKYLDHSFFEHRVHWMSIVNSCWIVVVLAGLLGVIVLRSTKADADAFATLDDEDEGRGGEDTVIKLIHRDLFRPPDAPELLAGIVGQGFHLAAAAVVLLAVGLVWSEMWIDKGHFVSAAVVMWFVMAVVGGVTSSGVFKWFGRLAPALAPRWKRVIFISWGLFPAVVATVGMAINIVAWLGYHSQQAIPFFDLVILLVLFLLQFPLVVAGTYAGRHYLPSTPQEALPRVAPYVRGIPRRPWYASCLAIIAVSGCLPFASVQVELYFIMAAVWHYKFYYVFGHALMVFLNFILTSMGVGAVVAYMLAAKEDHRWHWVVVGVGAAAGVYMYADAVYFFYSHTKMSGLLMTLYYFGYMGVFCAVLGFISGPWR